MGMLRLAACSLAIVGMLVFTRGLRAAESTPRHPRTRPTPKSSAAARQERERREDLERRVERLEQRYEAKDPAMPPAEPATRRPAP